MSAAYLTAKALAARWDCDASYVRRLCRRGQLRAMRLGADWRISQEAVSEYEARNTTTTAAPEAAPATNGVAVRQTASHPSLTVLDGALPERWWEQEQASKQAARPAARRGASATNKSAV